MHAPKTHTNTKQQGGISIHVFYCGYVYRLLYVREWFVGACGDMCSKAATARPTPCDALRVSLCLRALPMGERAQVCLVFVSVHRSVVHICDIYFRNMAPRWRVRSDVRLLLYGYEVCLFKCLYSHPHPISVPPPLPSMWCIMCDTHATLSIHTDTALG